MIALEISADFCSLVDVDLIEKAGLTALRYQSVGDEVDISIVITNDERLHNLNRQFRDIDTPTDVLSFPADFIDPENENPYLGDIIISYPRAAEQAATAGHTVMAELQLLVVHGILHLLGHDHAEPEEKATMWAAQRELLQQLGLDRLKIPESD